MNGIWGVNSQKSGGKLASFSCLFFFFYPEAHSRLVSHTVYGRGTSGCVRALDVRMVVKYERNESI